MKPILMKIKNKTYCKYYTMHIIVLTVFISYQKKTKKKINNNNICNDNNIV